MNFRRLEMAFAVFGIFYMTGAVITLLTPAGGSEDGAPAYRVLGLIIGITSIGLLALVRNSLDRVLRYHWLVIILTLIALMSGVWSTNPDLAMRRSGALALTVAFAIYLTERFDPRTLLNLLLVSVFGTCVASYVAIYAFPDFGVHQLGEAVPELRERFGGDTLSSAHTWFSVAPEAGSEFLGLPTRGVRELFDNRTVTHAGSWRGLFGHKNDFGRFAALAAILFLTAGLARREGRKVSMLAFILAAILVIQSRSAQALTLVVVPGGVMLLVCWLKSMDARARAITLSVLPPLSLAALLFWNTIFAGVLGLLGKDASLTGRTEIWARILDAMQARIFFGGGYGVGIRDFGNSIGHAHNGYLDMLVDLGLVGVCLALAVFAGMALRSVSRFFTSPSTETALLGIGFGTFYVLGNIVGSFLFDYNSLYCVLLVVLAGLMVRRGARRQVEAITGNDAREPAIP